MKVSYYPGCSLDGTAKEYGESTEAVARTLGVELKELPDWNCCGSSSAHVMNDELAIGLAANDLGLAEKLGMDLVVPCAMCFSRLKVAEKETEGEIKVKHLVDFLWDDVGEKVIEEKAKKSLEGLNPVCYYGCLTTRPPKVTDAKRPEDPQEMDKILRSLGADVKTWSYKTDCCGGSLILSLPEVAHRLIQKLLDRAVEAGADCIVAGCPMCQGNLDGYQKEISAESGNSYNMPILYFTELMGLAFGDPSANKWLGRHEVDPRPLLREKGLL